jgi:hypothetical protein
VLQVAGRKVSCSSRNSGSLSRWRIVALTLVIPGILLTSTVKVARAFSYKSQRIVSDGIDDDDDTFIVCGLPEEPAKKWSLTSVEGSPGAKIPCPAIIRPRLAHLESHSQSFRESSFPATRLSTLRAVRPDNPDSAH